MSRHLWAVLCSFAIFSAACTESTSPGVGESAETSDGLLPGAASGGMSQVGGGVPGSSGGALGAGASSAIGSGGSLGGVGATGGALDGPTGGSTSVGSVCPSEVQRQTQPFGCELAWGANGNEGNRATYLDFITTWIGYEHFQGRSGDCDGCGLAGTLEGTGVLAVYYAYFAGYALDDCNVNPEGPNLCTHGAQWLRDNRELYLSLYADYAAKTYAQSPNQGVAWLLEGDFVQYTYAEQQNPFSVQELGDLARDVVCAIKANAPNALVGMNHSTWISNELTDEFWAAMPTEIMDFVWTTGVGDNAGYMNADTTAGTYNATSSRYDYLHDLTGLGVFVDTSFGLSQMNDSWSSSAAEILNARSSEGVIAINVTAPPTDYQARLSALRPGLTGTCK